MDKPIAWIKARELTYMKAVVEHGATEWKTNLGLKPEDGDVPLYTAPPQREWRGLTDEEIKSAWSQLWYDLGNGKFAASDDPARHTTIMFAKEIEAKLKEKNHAI